MTAILNLNIADTSDALRQFRDALIRRGIVPPDEIIADGQIHRCDVEVKRGKCDASYLLHLDGIPSGGFLSWRDGRGWENWRADIGRKFTPAEEAAHQAKMEAQRMKSEAEKAKRHEEAREACVFTWNAAKPCDPTNPHPYLARKGVRAHGLKVTRNGRLIIPVRDTDGTLHSLQFVDAQTEQSASRQAERNMGVTMPLESRMAFCTSWKDT